MKQKLNSIKNLRRKSILSRGKKTDDSDTLRQVMLFLIRSNSLVVKQLVQAGVITESYVASLGGDKDFSAEARESTEKLKDMSSFESPTRSLLKTKTLKRNRYSNSMDDSLLITKLDFEGSTRIKGPKVKRVLVPQQDSADDTDAAIDQCSNGNSSFESLIDEDEDYQHNFEDFYTFQDAESSDLDLDEEPIPLKLSKGTSTSALWKDHDLIPKDSPELRKKLLIDVLRISQLKSHLKYLIKYFKTYCRSLQNSLTPNKKLALLLYTLSSKNENKYFAALGIYFQRIHSIKVRYLNGFLLNVVYPLEIFIREDVSSIFKAYQKYSQIKNLYENMEKKLIVLSNKKYLTPTHLREQFNQISLNTFNNLMNVKSKTPKKTLNFNFLVNTEPDIKVEEVSETFGFKIPEKVENEFLKEEMLGDKLETLQDQVCDLGTQHEMQRREFFTALIRFKQRKAVIMLKMVTSFAALQTSLTTRQAEITSLFEGAKSNWKTSHEEICRSLMSKTFVPDMWSSQDKIKNVVKEGYLYMRCASKNVAGRKFWKKKFVTLSQDHLFIWENAKARSVCQSRICTVKESQKENYENCFEVISPDMKKSLVLQTIQRSDMKSWIQSIQQTVAIGLAQMNVGTALDTQNAAQSLSIRSEIDHCCDCGAPAGEWVIINFGISVCIECSGVHRSLGVHISKVRSLRLDRLSETEQEILNFVGNDRFKEIFKTGSFNVNKVFDDESRRFVIQKRYSTLEFISNEIVAVESISDFPGLLLEFIKRVILHKIGNREPSKLQGVLNTFKQRCTYLNSEKEYVLEQVLSLNNIELN
eukprot:snap_masked-scaffold_13-processed-gene-4.30-mRNA-1 protein AED:0.44 eAED:0.44 QI:0/-1/0/1/-1/1/1/0/812